MLDSDLTLRTCNLCGDHLQLPPTIKSNEAAKAGLAKTLLKKELKNIATILHATGTVPDA